MLQARCQDAQLMPGHSANWTAISALRWQLYNEWRSHSQLRLCLCQLGLEPSHLPLRIQKPLRAAAPAAVGRERRRARAARQRGRRTGTLRARAGVPGTPQPAVECGGARPHRAEGSVRVRMRLAASSVRISCAARLRILSSAARSRSLACRQGSGGGAAGGVDGGLQSSCLLIHCRIQAEASAATCMLALVAQGQQHVLVDSRPGCPAGCRRRRRPPAGAGQRQGAGAAVLAAAPHG